jgi:hypothetical protein
MANYLVAGTNHTLDDYFYLLTYPIDATNPTNSQGQTQLTNFKQNGADLNTKYLPHALANNTTDTDTTGFRYKRTVTNVMTDLNKLFAMKITPTITGNYISRFINNTRQITFRGNGTIAFSNASNNPFRATVIVIGGGGGGANGTTSRTGQGGGGGAIAFGTVTLAVGVTYNATVPASAPANTNGINVLFAGNGSSITANGGNAGFGENGGGDSTNTVIVSQAAGQDWVANVSGNFGGAGGGFSFLTHRNGTNANTLDISYNNGLTITTRNYCGGGGSGSNTLGGDAGLNGNGGDAGSSGERAGGNALSTSYGAGGGGGAKGSQTPLVDGGVGGSGGRGAVIILF